MMPAWAMTLPWPEITAAAEKNKIPPVLVAAIVMVESSGQPHAMRFEPHFRWLKDPKYYAGRLGITVETETALQKMSFGLMQIMGGTARGLGFDGYLTELTNPRENLKWGCQYLAQHFARYPWHEAIAAYNAGSPRYEDGRLVNVAYVDKVLKRVNDLKGA